MVQTDPTAAALQATAKALEALARTQETQAATLEAVVAIVTTQGMKDAKLAVAVEGMTEQLSSMQARARELQVEARQRFEQNSKRIEEALHPRG